jgi:carboxypeptidase family protein
MPRAAIVSILAATLALGACGASGSGDGTSGVEGRALAGPQCPVAVEGSPCPDLPWEGTVVATAASSGDEFTVETDADGGFRLPLAPGDYVLTIRAGSSPPFATPQTVTVEPGAFADVVISVDTGIR